MTAATLHVDAVSITYRSRNRVVHAVRKVGFDVPAGGSLAVVGESGSGKSTIARAIAGIVPVTAGQIRVDGDIIAVRNRRTDVQMVFQDPATALNPRRTVGSSLAEILRIRGTSGHRRARAAATELLELVGLDGQIYDRRPSRLSGGQRQRVSIARALAARPRILVADEATSALDVTTQAAILQLFRQLQRDQGCTLVMITHDLSVAREVCSDMVVMRDGFVVERGACEEVMRNPQDQYTADLLASVLPMPEATMPEARMPDPRRSGTKP